MASNPPPSRPSLTKRLQQLGVLIVLALGVGALLLSQGHKPAPPPAPQAAMPAPAANGPTPPEFDVVRVDAQGNAVFAGRGAPGATITILDNGKLVGTATADSQGAFVLVPSAPLPQGASEITLSEAVNGQTVQSQTTAEVNVPANGTGQALAVISGPNGSAVVSGQGLLPGTLGIGAADYDTNGHAIFSGTAPAGSAVTLSLNGKLLGTAIATAKGTWSFTVATPAASGTLTLSGTSATGQPLTVFTAPFALESLPAALAEGHVLIVPGDNLWVIARHVYGHGILYTLIYTANHSQIHDPNLIYPGQNFALPKPKENN